MCAMAAAESSVWKVSGNDHMLYLGGSVHILRAEDFPLPAEFDAAFNLADTLVLETDVVSLSADNIMLSLMDRIMLPEGTTLETLLDKDVYEQLKNTCAEFGIPVESVADLKPTLLMSVLAVLKMQQQGFIELGGDFHYAAIAKEEGKRFGFLEDIEVQIDLLLNTDDIDNNEFVLYSLKDFDNTGENINALVDEWKNGSAKILEAALSEMRSEFPSVYKREIADRNNAWIPIIEQYLTDDPVEFVIAGLAHFYGPDGLLLQLQNKGYLVEKFILGE
jgi:uncharacterized protein YbaP (TraB family)